MAFPYCTGPCLIYAGISVQWTDVLTVVNQLPTEIQLQPGGAGQEVVLGAGGAGEAEPVPWQGGPGGIQVNPIPQDQAPNVITTFINQLFTLYVPVFLGTCDGGAELQLVAEWEGVETDSGGSGAPSERLSDGEEAVINVTISRWNEPVYLALAARSQGGGLFGQFPGLGVVGSAMGLAGIGYPLWLVFPYTQKSRYLLTGQTFGYRFFRAFLESPDVLGKLAGVPRETSLTFRAQRLIQLIESVSDLLQPIPNYTDITIPVPVLPLGQPLINDIDSSVNLLYDFDLNGLPAAN